ncbi:MAG: methyltransferase domain-containing protein [Candidatus Margulisiibacteriota bacterium]
MPSKQAFDNAAATYEAVDFIQQQSAEALLGRFIEEVPQTATALVDLGCGTGRHTVSLANHFPKAKVLGVDASPNMITYAQDHHAHDRVTYQLGVAPYWMSFQTHDGVFSNAVLQWVEDLEKTIDWLQEAVLKPGGVLAASLFGPRTFHEWGAVLEQQGIPASWISASRFPTQKTLSGLLKNWTSAECSTQTFTKTFGSTRELLVYIRMLGAKETVSMGLWTPRFLEQLDSVFNEKFGEVRVTFDIHHVVARA